jgi:hypothetical protein
VRAHFRRLEGKAGILCEALGYIRA